MPKTTSKGKNNAATQGSTGQTGRGAKSTKKKKATGAAEEALAKAQEEILQLRKENEAANKEVGKLKRKVGELEKGKKKKKRGGRKRGAESSSDEEPEEGGERSISKPDGEHPRNFNMQRKLNVKQDVWNATFALVRDTIIVYKIKRRSGYRKQVRTKEAQMLAVINMVEEQFPYLKKCEGSWGVCEFIKTVCRNYKTELSRKKGKTERAAAAAEEEVEVEKGGPPAGEDDDDDDDASTSSDDGSDSD